MSNTRGTRIRQRLARTRQELRKADTELSNEKRRRDTRRKVLVGSVVLDVLIPRSASLRDVVGRALGRAVVNNTRKSTAARSEELDLFRDDLGAEWVAKWKSRLRGDESA